MAVILRYMQTTLFACVLMLCKPVVCENTFRSSYVKVFEACSLAEATSHAMLDSADCRYACLAQQDSGSCAAYQWEAETRTCRLQETLNVTASLSGDTVGVLMDTDEPACSNDTDCPLNHTCQDVNSASRTFSAICIAADCAAILAASPCSSSGVYSIHAGTQHPHKVWCDMDTDGGGWTVFLRRLDGSVDFYLNLADYKQGFGKVSGEYWLSLDVLHALTSSNMYQLRIDMADWEGLSAYSLYASMLVANESDGYMLTLGSFIGGEGGHALNKNNGMKFSTKDADRDKSPVKDCAKKHKGAFWYPACLPANPTGKYYNGGWYSSSQADGVLWRKWDLHTEGAYSLKTLEMKLRP